MARPKGIKFNLKGMQELRNLPEVRAFVGELAHQVAEEASNAGAGLHVFDEGAADDDDSGYQVTDLVLQGNRSGFSVMAVGAATRRTVKNPPSSKG